MLIRVVSRETAVNKHSVRSASARKEWAMYALHDDNGGLYKLGTVTPRKQERRKRSRRKANYTLVDWVVVPIRWNTALHL